jgi:hypothetical protein
MEITATIIHGLGIAGGSGPGAPERGSIALQKPLLVRYFPEIAACHNGTINLLLDEPLEIRLPDVVTPPLRWRPYEPEFDERFGFKKITFILDGRRHPAWIYIAERSQHLFKTGMIELVAEEIPGVQYGARCALHIERAQPAHLFTA